MDAEIRVALPYEFVKGPTNDGRIIRALNSIGKFEEALVIRTKRRLNSTDTVDALTNLLIILGLPELPRADNVADKYRQGGLPWIESVAANTACNQAHCENGYFESLNARVRDGLLRT